LVDCSSSIGIIEIDVADSAVDGLLVAPRGNALGTQGICFLFVDALKLSSHPGLKASFNSVVPPNLFGQQQHIHFIDLLTAEAALKAINVCEVSCIEKHACGLAAQLRLVFEEIGMPLDNPLDASHQSHVVAVGLPSPLSDLKGLSEKLKSGRVRFANCRGQLQFGFHLYNRLQDVLDIRRVVTQ
jgi:selenocysteine lyase/cysteine desulfurase